MPKPNYVTLWDSPEGRALIEKRNPSVYNSLKKRERTQAKRANDLLRTISRMKAPK